MEARTAAQPRVEGPARLATRPGTERCCRALDVVLAAVLLVLLAPLLLALGIAVRLDSPGPALFRQRRVGRGGRTFTLLKLRTMQRAADAGPHRDYVLRMIAGQPVPVAGNGVFKLAADARVTRVGRVLRRWSVDELPQLWNVLRGDMSLVGPRPAIEYEVERYPAWCMERLSVKPGITGLWQVSGRNERTFEEMVLLDLEYVRRRSVRLNALILAKTPWVVLRRRGVA